MKKEAMGLNFSRFFLGFFIALIGLIILLNSLNIYIFKIDFWNLIPALIIFIGLCFFSGRNWFSILIGTITTVVSMVIILISLFNHSAVIRNSQYFYFPLAVSKDFNAEKAAVNINSGDGQLNIYGIQSDSLVLGNIKTNTVAYKTSSETSDEGIQSVTLNLQKGIKGNTGNQTYLGLNSDFPLDLSIDSSAADNKIDLSGIDAEKISIHTAISNIDLKLGDKADSSSVAIDSKANSLNMLLPGDAGVQLILSSNLNSRNFIGFKLVGKGIYRSTNYNSSSKKISISIKTNISAINVEWYSPQKKSQIDLYYYNPTEDKGGACSSEFIFPLMREVSLSDDPIKDSINLLLKGDLTDQEKSDGFRPYFPNSNLRLLNSSLDDNGKLTLTFNEVPGFTSGNQCRNNILALEIVKTARQFPEVKKVVFEPDSLFEK